MFAVLVYHLAVLAQRSLPDQTGNLSLNISGEIAVGLQDATALVPVCECL